MYAVHTCTRVNIKTYYNDNFHLNLKHTFIVDPFGSILLKRIFKRSTNQIPLNGT